MKNKIRRIVGISLLGVGGLLLLQSLNFIVGDFGNILLAVVLGTVGVSFTYLYLSNRNHWWWLIPGIALIGLALSNLVELMPGTGLYLKEFFALGGIGLGFLMVYFNDRINWWALIPGGVLISLGAVTIFEELSLPGFDPGGVLFLGIGLTFLLLYALPTPYGRLTWALIPALLMLAFGGAIGFQGGIEILNYLGPILIILLGLFVLVKTVKKP